MYWYAGELIQNDTLSISISDPGLLYGATVFTTLRVYDRSLDHPLTHWKLHCDRLHNSLKAFEWQLPDWLRLRQGAEILLKKAEGRGGVGAEPASAQRTPWQRAEGRERGQGEGGKEKPIEDGRQKAVESLTYYSVLRIAIFPDGREWIVGRALPQDLEQRQQQGVIGWVAEEGRGEESGTRRRGDYSFNLFPNLRSLPIHKTGNYLSAWLALQKAIKLGAKEAILIDDRGNWLETSGGNLWGWKDGCWWTPDLEKKLLPGIVRSQLLQWLQAKNIPVEQNQWTPDFVRDLEAIAYSNSVVEIVPFSSIIISEGQLSLNPTHQALEKLRSYFEEGSKES
jgi:4-amino-4-deoxychorismate lyase